MAALCSKCARDKKKACVCHTHEGAEGPAVTAGAARPTASKFDSRKKMAEELLKQLTR